MTISGPSKLLFLLSFLTSSALGDSYFAPYTDPQCSRAFSGVNYNDIPTNGSKSFELPQWPTQTKYSNSTFPGANSSSGGSGAQVWWKSSPPVPGCRNILMMEYSQGNYGLVGPNQPAGNIIISAGREGCFYSSISQFVNLIGTYCCGDDCNDLSLGSPDLTSSGGGQITNKAKRGGLSPNGGGSSAVGPTATVADQKRAAPSEDCVVHSGQVVTVFAHTMTINTDWPYTTCTGPAAAFNPADCEAPPPSAPTVIAAGKQVIIGEAVNCNPGPCSFSTTSSNSTGTTLSSSTDTTITNGGSYSFSIQAGITWPMESTVSDTYGYSFSKAIGKTIGQVVSNTTTYQFSTTENMEGGTVGYFTFTPTLTCWPHMQLKCGSAPANGDFAFCQPNVNTANGITSPQGEYGIVYTG